jgi:phosphatidylcholine synthase
LLPAFIVLLSPLLPEQFRLAGASVILLSSCYQFSQTNAKTDDHFFRGFPSYWNLLVIYLALLETSTMINSLAVIACSVMTFVPIYYIYPSRTPILRRLTLWLSLPWIILLLGGVLLDGRNEGVFFSQILTLCSLYYIAYYLFLSLFLSFKRSGFKKKLSIDSGENRSGKNEYH